VPPGTPGGASRDRGAPARGVDVKPLAREPRDGVPGPWRGPGRPPDGPRGPRRGPGGQEGSREAPGPGPAGPARGVLHQPLAPGPRGSRRGSGRALRGPGAQIPGNPGFWRKTPKIPYFWGFPAIPGERPFLGLPGYRGAPARGVDVKPPSRRGPGDPENPHFAQKGAKRAKITKNGQKGPFSCFWGFSGPLGPPRGSRKRGFYINPSRRGPAVPRRGWGGKTRRPGAG